MQLTEGQIKEIRNFISKRGIKYLDVQMEIIDHTASAIEERMNADPKLSFEEALKQTHLSFGIFGFGGMEDALVNAMSKKYNRIFWRVFISCFKLKYIFLVSFGALFCYHLQTIIKDHNQILISLLVVSIIFILLLKLYEMQNKDYRKLLVFRVSMGSFVYIGFFVQLFNFVVYSIPNKVIVGINLPYGLISLFMVIFVIYAISAVKTAAIGVEEAERLNAKYAQLNY